MTFLSTTPAILLMSAGHPSFKRRGEFYISSVTLIVKKYTTIVIGLNSEKLIFCTFILI
jgi:hypothetical protein